MQWGPFRGLRGGGSRPLPTWCVVHTGLLREVLVQKKALQLLHLKAPPLQADLLLFLRL